MTTETLDREDVAPAEAPPRTRSPARVVAVAALALLAMYMTLSFLDDTRGTLGSDSGAKVATLRVMGQRNTFDPDIGYWAEKLDPRGRLHPMYASVHIDDRWIGVTTVPMLVVVHPLYELGGMRAALLVPMLGGVLAALAARALARRLGDGGGWWAFWAVGLATPIAVYALDFWEHSLGVAAMVWAVVFVLDVIDGRAGWRGALAAGALFGLAATMRTEALVYALVAVGTVWLELGRSRVAGTRAAAVARVGAMGTGIAGVLVANELLERLIIGDGFRSGRASATAGGAAGGITKRIEEALTTMVGLTRFPNAGEWVLGVVLVIALGVVAWGMTRDDARARRVATVAGATAVFIYLLRFATGLGFVPGMLTASPLAVAGILLWRDGRGRRMVGLAVAALPIVWVFQYSGGAGPQWGGRYVLVTGTLLAIAGVIALRSYGRIVFGLFFVAGLAVTACGIAWTSARSHAVADAMERLESRRDEVLVSRERFLLREGGAFYEPDQRWLTAPSDRERRRAFEVAAEAGFHEVRLIQAPERPIPQSVAGFSRQATERIDFFPNTPVNVITYRG
ncbi:MAG: hypothetical protein WEB19_00765 [Acidimicrobiia bacterium]